MIKFISKKLLIFRMFNAFIDRLVEEKGLDNVEEETLKQIKLDLHERLDDRINAAILEHMPPERVEEFDKILDSADELAIQAFCKNAISNFDEVVAAALVAFRQTYLGM